MPGRPAPDLHATVFAWVAVIIGVVTPVLQVTPVGPFPRIIAMIVFVCFGPGTAAVCHTRLGDWAAAWTVALVLSLSIYASVSVTMIWTSQWHPLSALVGLSAVTVGSAVTQLARKRRAAGAAKPAATVPNEIFARVISPPDLQATQVIPAQHPHGSLPATSFGYTPPWYSIVSESPMSGVTGDHPVAGKDQESHLTLDDTAIIPAITDATAILPAITDDTAIIPAITDATAILPAIGSNAPARDSTEALPLPRGWLDIADASAGRPEPPAKPFVGDGWARVIARTAAGWLPGWNSTHLLLIAGALTLWILSLGHIDGLAIGDYGLLASVPWMFFAAFALCATGFAFEIVRGARRHWAMIGYLIIVLLMLHATVPVILHEPEYAWTYKHVAVIEYLQANGAVHDRAEIYQQWPTFFATVAGMASTAGASPLRLSAWAPLFFDTANCLPLFAIVRTLANDRRMPYLVVFLFSCANWATQDYLSPQAFAFLLSLGGILMLLRWVRRVPGAAERIRPRFVRSIWSRVAADAPKLPYISARTTQFALASLYLVYATLCSAHQLTPYMFALDAMAMLAFGMLSSWRLIPILLGIAIMYVIPRRHFVDTYGALGSFNIFKNASGNADGWATAGQIFSAEVVRGLSLAMWGTAVLAVFIHRRRLGQVAVPAVLAFAPFGLLMAQSYGGEAIYRVFLFSIPWASYLAAILFLKIKRLPQVALGIAGAALLTAIPLASIQGMHGQLEVNHFSTAEVRASQYIYNQAPSGSTIVLAAANFPGPLGPRYDEFVPDGDTFADLVGGAKLLNSSMGPNVLPIINSYVLSQHGTRSFLVISDAMRRYAHYFGRLPDGALDNLEATLSSSPNWTLYYHNSDTSIYEYVPATSDD